MSHSYMLHNVDRLEDVSLDEWNSNALSFTARLNGGSDRANFTFFNMPNDVATQVYNGLKDNSVKEQELKQRVRVLEDALERISRGSVKITDIGLEAKLALESDPNYIYIPF